MVSITNQYFAGSPQFQSIFAGTLRSPGSRNDQRENRRAMLVSFSKYIRAQDREVKSALQ